MEIKKEKINLVNTIKSIVKKDENLQEWQEYVISDIFDVSIAKSIDKGKVKKDLEGVNYITRKSTNNGLEYKVETVFNSENEGNCITMVMIGSKGTCYYQEQNFLSSQNMLIFRNTNINKNIGKYLSVIFEKKYKISVDYNAIKKDLVLKDKIKLPSKWNDEFEFEPDWEYMNKYISDLEKEIKLNQIKKQINNIELIRKEELNINEWQEYVISDIFEGKTGDVDIQNKDINDRGIFVITSGVKNSGILGKTDIDAKIFKKNTITIDMFGNVFYRGYDYKMATHGRVFSIRTIDVNTNKFHNIFLTSVLNNIFPFIFSYGHMCSWNRVKDFKIKLPSKWNDEFEFEPDWEYMNKYISDLKKGIKYGN